MHLCRENILLIKDSGSGNGSVISETLTETITMIPILDTDASIEIGYVPSSNFFAHSAPKIPISNSPYHNPEIL